MKTLTKRIFALVGVLALGLSAVHAQDTALIDALVKKGVLSDQEAEDIRADISKEYSTTSAGKLSISNHITNLKLYGDARVRFEYLDERPQAGTATGGYVQTTNRNRYRIRVGADYTFTDNFTAGFELESNTAADSANQSMGSQFGKFPIDVGLVYLQWKPTDWATLTGGKQRNPIYTTDLVWDPDINPEGGSEVLSWTVPIDFGSDEAPISSDPKAIAPPVEPSESSLTIGLIGAQFDYADNSEFNSGAVTATAGNAKTDVWMFTEQVPIQFNIDKTTFIKEVPGFTSYMGGGITDPSTVVSVNGALGNTTTSTSGSVGNNSSVGFFGPHATDHLQILTAPGEFDWKSWDIPFKIYWDFAWNTQGKARIQDVYFANGNGNQGNVPPNLTQANNKDLGDNIAWLAGVQVGQNKKKGDWSIKGDFRQTGLGSVDPNLNDSDFADSYLNQQGFKVQSVYNFTDFLTGSLTYFDTWDYKKDLLNGPAGSGEDAASIPLGGSAKTPVGASGVTSSTGAGSLAGIRSTERVQVDLQWKF